MEQPRFSVVANGVTTYYSTTEIYTHMTEADLIGGYYMIK
jgi:hypothetical protein